MAAISTETKVVIAGAGPTGLALACELARRNVPFRLVDSAPEPFKGSRAKGLQPRTLEVFEDLGILKDVLAIGSDYPGFRVHAGPFSMNAGRLNKIVAPTPAVPYPNLWMLPQWHTTELLREQVERFGGRAEHGTALTALVQDEKGVTATLASASGEEQVRCDYLVGCDGGHSFVRKALDVRLVGEDIEGMAIVVGDLEIDGLDRTRWHSWPFAKGCMFTLCPLPGTNCFQLQAPLRKGVEPPETSETGIRRFIDHAMGVGKLNVGRIHWTGLYRSAHARMVDRYRVGRVLLAGDAAHVHPPSGGQGLNTGVQDAYNLGWKLAGVVNGAPDSLLDTYQAERLPIAASVLGLAKKLFVKRSVWRGSETQQLGLHYRGGPLAEDARPKPAVVRAGDRAPDAPGKDATGTSMRLFQLFNGTRWTLLAFGNGQGDVLSGVASRWSDAVRVVRVVEQSNVAGADVFVDSGGHARNGYGAQSSALVLVRPDGYVGYFAEPGTWVALDSYLSRLLVR